MVSCRLQIYETQTATPVCANCGQEKSRKHMKKLLFSLNYCVMGEWLICKECLMSEHIDVRK